MKKILSIALITAMAMPLFAQEQEEAPKVEKKAKDYSEYLPQQGDFSLGFSINPIATFIGNFFNGYGTNGVANRLGAVTGEPLAKSQLLGTPNMASIMGSYMISDNWAFRANIALGIQLGTNRQYVIDDAAKFINPYSTLEGLDRQKWQNIGAAFSAGAEYHLGKRRVQGVFGVGLTYGFWGVTRNDYTYLNAFTDANQNPTNAGLAPAPALPADYAWLNNPRLKSQYTTGGTHILGVYGSVGVECFVAPKVALGLNVNVLLDYEWSPARVAEYEGWNSVTQQAQQIMIHNGAARTGFTFSTDNIGANLYMAFYFGKK